MQFSWGCCCLWCFHLTITLAITSSSSLIETLITWRLQGTGRDSDYDSDASPRMPATGLGSQHGSLQQLDTAPPSARPPAVPSLNLVSGRKGGAGSARSRRSARSQPGSGQGKGGTAASLGIGQR